jgi:3-methyladenine DNA glycosylase AlkD
MWLTLRYSRSKVNHLVDMSHAALQLLLEHTSMTIITGVKDALAQLEALGNERMRAQNIGNGAMGRQFGVPLGDIRKMAAGIKAGHPLVIDLWETSVIEAQLLAILLIKPKQLSIDDMNRLVRSIDFVQVADWFSAYVAKKHPEKETLRCRWMTDADAWTARLGWSLTSERIAKQSEGLDLAALLDRIESEMASAPSQVQWTMNFCLAGIGIHFPTHRKRSIAIGEKLGLYRDYPVSKGCTSPFAPIWINEMVSRQA